MIIYKIDYHSVNMVGRQCCSCQRIKTNPREEKPWREQLELRGNLARATGKHACPECIPDPDEEPKP